MESLNTNADIDKTIAERGAQYGPPKENHARTARLWNAYLACRKNEPLTPTDICLLNILQKVARTMSEAGPSRDTLMDMAGYARNIDLMLFNEGER